MPQVNREKYLLTLAADQLEGVGDVSLGEWRERGDIAVHLRRRLTPIEMALGGIDSACDIRGTKEFEERICAMLPYLPSQMQGWSLEAYP